jgi:hypothetical protein
MRVIPALRSAAGSPFLRRSISTMGAEMGEQGQNKRFPQSDRRRNYLRHYQVTRPARQGKSPDGQDLRSVLLVVPPLLLADDATAGISAPVRGTVKSRDGSKDIISYSMQEKNGEVNLNFFLC